MSDTIQGQPKSKTKRSRSKSPEPIPISSEKKSKLEDPTTTETETLVTSRDLDTICDLLGNASAQMKPLVCNPYMIFLHLTTTGEVDRVISVGLGTNCGFYWMYQSEFPRSGLEEKKQTKGDILYDLHQYASTSCASNSEYQGFEAYISILLNHDFHAIVYNVTKGLERISQYTACPSDKCDYCDTNHLTKVCDQARSYPWPLHRKFSNLGGKRVILESL